MQSPTLIKANIALFKGDRAETLRLVDEYRREHPQAAQDPLLLWLDAQAQTDPAETLRRLQELAAVGDPASRYVELARETVKTEAEYAARIHPASSPRFTSGAWRIFLLVLLGGFAGFILNSAFTTTGRGSDVLIVTATPAAPQAPTEPFDRSEALVAEGFTVRYDAGILQVAAYEDRSERVMNSDSVPAIPVPGGRFYALSLVFECRTGICDNPPEAELAIRMDNGDIIPARTDLTVEERLQPIALGRTTRGWVVFELPLVNGIEALLITPAAATGATPVLLSIPLPAP